MASPAVYTQLEDPYIVAVPSYSFLRRASRVVSFAIMSIFLGGVLCLGIVNQYTAVSIWGIGSIISSDEALSSLSNKPKLPDFAQYGQKLKSLAPTEMYFESSGGRLIVVGDIHGMSDSLNKLLKKLDYDFKKDQLMHVGDLVTKGALSGSLAVLEQLSSLHISGVRGNHDQKVIEWRAWMDWVQSLPNGREWLETFKDDTVHTTSKKKYVNRKFPFPDDWKWGSDHWMIARHMKKDHYNYLLSLPTVLHLPSVHTHLVHAGVLPIDPTRSFKSKKQPLSHIPFIEDYITNAGEPNITSLRSAQEVAVITDIRQNRNPWVNLNLRAVLNNGRVTRENGKGSPWYKVWNHVMDRCGGFNDATERKGEERRDIVDDILQGGASLPCHPFNIIYGHTASRGLITKKWTTGLDTGCVYGRRLTALVYSGNATTSIESSDEDEFAVESISFGQNPGKARIVSVPCRN